MPLSLYVDGQRWRGHLRAVGDTHPGLVPVAKANGYGFGTGRLARRAQWLGSDLLAVGTYEEVAEVASRFAGDILVMTPWRSFQPEPAYGPRLVHTVAAPDDLRAIAGRDRRPRVVLEGLTSMHRHGMRPAELAVAAGRLSGVRLEGLALHLPIDASLGHLAEVERWLGWWRDAGLRPNRVFVSHLGFAELDRLRRRHPGVELRPRIGTGLWLGDLAALTIRATVLDSHPVRRGSRVGYRQRRLLRGGTLLVLSGGTAHGIGLEAPTAATSLRQRAISVARGGLDAAGLALSPYTVAGRQRWFAEPPHMQVSLVFLPAGAAVPALGDEVEVDLRHTATRFDRVVIR
jgi:alanine racemase-like protein